MSGAAFEQQLLRRIAASMALPYAALAREYPQPSYSWAPVNMREQWRRAEARRKPIADALFARVVLPLLIEMNAPAIAARSLAEQQRVAEFYEARL